MIDLTASERAAVARLEDRSRELRRDTILIREDDPHGELFVLQRGMAMTYVLLDDGSRQILRFLFPGDLIAVSALVYRNSPETIVTLTDCTVSPFDRSLLVDVVTDHPRLAALLMVVTQMAKVALTDRLAALGRTSAKARIGALLLDIRNRLRRADKSIGETFALVLTQEEIGDATGLTSVHVNRMLRQLEEEGLLQRDGGRMTLLNEPMLTRIANYVDRWSGLDLSWLPPAR
ncbi:Crp/Fnr family transcriptional regulator [Sphingomonas ginsenosidivorax]|uniref:Crp/Fnr family transcriptional regulator n=1 Tax=Sphingomonas ginsenosidivorax TaxID=862135 RepID=A0A5C6UKF7_9SPHN|nr:Crp/Fnr family transcriptional regulator [Sphingomonas ginsenosidivorax]